MMTIKKAFPAVVLLAALWIAPAWAADGQVYKLQISGLACPFCAYGLEMTLKNVGGVERATVSLAEGVVIVTTAEGAIFDRETAAQIVRRAGFTLRGFERSEVVATN